MNEIKVGAYFHVTREKLLTTPKDVILRHAIEDLSSSLSHAILNKTGIFETEEMKDGLRISAECYVLTLNDFSELVEKIQQDLTRFGPSVAMIGGVYP